MKLPNTLSIFLHLGAVLKTGKDFEMAISNFIKTHKLNKSDLLAIIADLEALVNAQLINIAEFPNANIVAVLEELKALT